MPSLSNGLSCFFRLFFFFSRHVFSLRHLHDMFGEQRGGYTYLLRDSTTSGSDLVAVDAEHNLIYLSANNNLAVNKIFIGHNDEILDLRLILLLLDNKDSPTQQHQRIAVATNSAQV